MDEPVFQELDDVHTEITRIKNVWGIYEEFQDELSVLAKEDWVTFRSKTYRFDEFLSTWQEKLRNSSQQDSVKASKKHSSTNMNVRIQQDIDNYRLLTPLFKWIRGETLSSDHWLELFRILQLPRGLTLEKLTFGDVLKAKDQIMSHSDQLKVRSLNERKAGEKKNCFFLDV